MRAIVHDVFRSLRVVVYTQCLRGKMLLDIDKVAACVLVHIRGTAIIAAAPQDSACARQAVFLHTGDTELRDYALRAAVRMQTCAVTCVVQEYIITAGTMVQIAVKAGVRPDAVIRTSLKLVRVHPFVGGEHIGDVPRLRIGGGGGLVRYIHPPSAGTVVQVVLRHRPSPLAVGVLHRKGTSSRLRAKHHDVGDIRLGTSRQRGTHQP